MFDHARQEIVADSLSVWRNKVNDDPYFVKIVHVDWDKPAGSVSVVSENADGISLKVRRDHRSAFSSRSAG